MFIKNTKKLDSFIGVNSVFKGEVKTEGTLRIDGTIDGNVNADCVVISEKASIQGDIAAKSIIVGGRVEGNLKAEEAVEIKSKGKVFGDISVNKLSILEGGIFSGRVSMERDVPKIIEFEVKEG